jgi:hypothetical protein
MCHGYQEAHWHFAKGKRNFPEQLCDEQSSAISAVMKFTVISCMGCQL